MAKTPVSSLGKISLLLSGFSSLVFCDFTHAEARFMDLNELAARSDVIAVIEILNTEKLGERFSKGLPEIGGQRYAQKNSFRFVDLIKFQKGIALDTKKVHTLWAQEDFICAHVSYATERYLVFLADQGNGEWTTLNYHVGGLPIDNNGNIAHFGFYKTGFGDGYKGALNLREAKKMIAGAMISDGSVSFYARVEPAFRPSLNSWRSNARFQRLLFNLEEYVWINREYRKVEVGRWPKGLSFHVAGFINTGSIKREVYERLIEKGGTFKIEGYWKEGHLYLRSIQDALTKKIVL